MQTLAYYEPPSVTKNSWCTLAYCGLKSLTKISDANTPAYFGLKSLTKISDPSTLAYGEPL